MAANPFDDRALSEVILDQFGMFIREDGNNGATVTVSIRVSREGGTARGPSVRTELFVPFDHDTTSVRGARLAAFERALNLIRRIGAENAESLNAEWEKTYLEIAEEIEREESTGQE